MQRKINEAFLQEYCNRFCDQISDDFFDRNEMINGKQILTLSPSKQVNFFVLKTLFTTWQEEMKRLESPYFNFRDPEVRNAMVGFMNLLSQKIEIKQSDFNPLLVSAVYETLHLLVDPVGYTVAEFSNKGMEMVSEKALKTYLKYIKVFKEEFEESLNGVQQISLEDLSQLLEDHFSELDPEEELRNQLDVLTTVSEISIEELLEMEVSETALDEFSISEDLLDLEESREELAETEMDAEEDGGDTESDADQFIANQEEVDKEPSVSYDSEETYSESAILEEQEEKLLDQEADEEVLPQEVESADENMASEDESFDEEDEPEEDEDDMLLLNERLEKQDKPMLEKPLQTKISNIMDAISVTNRQLFTKVLFDGDREAFDETVSQIEACESFDEAVEMIVHEHAKVRDWDMNSDEVKELLKVVFRRFR